MFKNLELENFINELSSSKPTPGGGSVAALVGSFSAALNNMVYSLTTNKKAFQNLKEEEKNIILNSVERTTELQNNLLQGMEEDKSAFEGLMDSYKLPKDTEEQLAIRKKEIQVNTIKALEAPLNLARESVKLYEEIRIAVKYGNKGAISDAGVSAILINSAIESAIMNVKINLAYLNDEDYKNSVKQEIAEIAKASSTEKEELVKKVYEIIGE